MEQVKWADVAHMYLGAEMLYILDGRPFKGTKKCERLTIENFQLLMFSTCRKPILRPLASMTDAEAIKIGSIAFDLHNHKYPASDYRVKRGSDTIIVEINNDWWSYAVRIGIKTGNLWRCTQGDNEASTQRVYNQPAIFIELLKNGFDLFSLIPSSQAIEKK